MLVSAHDGGIDHGIFVVGILGQMIEDGLPDTANSPPAEPRMRHTEVAEPFRQVAPWNPGTIAIQYSLDKQPVVPGRTTHDTLTSRQQILYPIPLIVSQPIPPYTHPLNIKFPQRQAYSELDDTP